MTIDMKYMQKEKFTRTQLTLVQKSRNILRARDREAARRETKMHPPREKIYHLVKFRINGSTSLLRSVAFFSEVVRDTRRLNMAVRSVGSRTHASERSELVALPFHRNLAVTRSQTTGRGTGRDGGARGEEQKTETLLEPTGALCVRRRNKNKKRTLCARPTAARRLDQTNKSLSPLWSLAYLRPATDSLRQVPRLFLAFPGKKILCVPAYVLTAEEKF